MQIKCQNIAHKGGILSDAMNYSNTVGVETKEKKKVRTCSWSCQYTLVNCTDELRQRGRERIKDRERNTRGNIQWGDGTYAGRRDNSHQRDPQCQETHEGSLKPYTFELLPPCMAWLNRIGCCVVAWIPLIPLIHLLHLKLWRKDI